MAPNEEEDRNENVNGNIKLSWPQLIWSLALITTILFTYADMKFRVDSILVQVKSLRTVEEENLIIYRLDQTDRIINARIRRLERKLAIDSAEE